MVEKNGLESNLEVKSKKNKKVLIIVVIVILLLMVLALSFEVKGLKGYINANVFRSNNYIFDDPNYQQNMPFNINNVAINMEGKDNFDLYIGGEGGAFSQKSYIEITNNNPNVACFRVYCEMMIVTDSLGCYPEYNDNNWFCVESNSKSVQEIQMHSFMDSTTTIESYSGSINIDLVKYWDEKRNEYIFKDSRIKAYPITINIYDNRDQ